MYEFNNNRQKLLKIEFYHHSKIVEKINLSRYLEKLIVSKNGFPKIA